MEIEKTEFGFKATVPLLTEDEMKKINDDFDNMINKFLDMIIKDKDLATAQYIIKKQQEQINELKRNSIPKKKIEHDLEVCQNVYKKEMKPYQTEYGLDVTYLSKKEKQELVNKRNCLITQMETYKQLLEEK